MSLVRKIKVKAKVQTIFHEELRARIRDLYVHILQRENNPVLCKKSPEQEEKKVGLLLNI